MKELYTVVHKDGTPWTKTELQYFSDNEMSRFAANRVDGFVIDNLGNLYVLDMCGNYIPAPDDCKIIMRERTCTIVETREYCDPYLGDPQTTYKFSCGHKMTTDDQSCGYQAPAYCPWCGAEVVDE